MCRICKGHGEIVRPIHTKTVAITRSMQSRGVVDNYYVEETVVLGGADACPKCTRLAEIEYQAGKA
tara:strand:- start:2030 stop:2227 length:198 start_codon:yes stop_codon:yes gene_type:complete